MLPWTCGQLQANSSCVASNPHTCCTVAHSTLTTLHVHAAHVALQQSPYAAEAAEAERKAAAWAAFEEARELQERLYEVCGGTYPRWHANVR